MTSWPQYTLRVAALQRADYPGPGTSHVGGASSDSRLAQNVDSEDCNTEDEYEKSRKMGSRTA
jgi:hypothetical protein